MVSPLDRPDRVGLITNVGVALAIVLVLEGLIFSLGWAATSARSPRFLPPPIVIGAVWIALFPCMALARWELNRAMSVGSDKAGLIALFMLCATYPLYTAGLSNDLVGEVANVSLCVLAGWLAAHYRRRVPRATAWLVPLVLWLCFASIAGAYNVAHMG
jgi:tryptophan-rich sensory protein